MTRHSLPVLAWSACRLATAYTIDQLSILRVELETDPANTNPEHATGRSIFLYNEATRTKLDALAWAVTYKLADLRAERESGTSQRAEMVF